MRLHRRQAGHYTLEAKARLRWEPGEPLETVPVTLSLTFEPDWALPAWGLVVETVEDHCYLVKLGDVVSATLRDLRALTERMLTEGWWEYHFSLGWCWTDEREEQKKLIHVLAEAEGK